jgi:hypothetical protein
MGWISRCLGCLKNDTLLGFKGCLKNDTLLGFKGCLKNDTKKTILPSDVVGVFGLEKYLAYILSCIWLYDC